MKINDPIKNNLGLSVDKTNAGKLESATTSKLAKTQVDADASENVTLSLLSAQLKSLEAKIATTNVYDAKKVDEIKSAISSGQFKVDSQKVADGLIATVKDLLTTQKP